MFDFFLNCKNFFSSFQDNQPMHTNLQLCFLQVIRRNMWHYVNNVTYESYHGKLGMSWNSKGGQFVELWFHFFFCVTFECVIWPNPFLKVSNFRNFPLSFTNESHQLCNEEFLVIFKMHFRLIFLYFEPLPPSKKVGTLFEDYSSFLLSLGNEVRRKELPLY